MGESPFFWCQNLPSIFTSASCESPFFWLWRCLHLSLHGGWTLADTDTPRKEGHIQPVFLFLTGVLFPNLTVLDGIHQPFFLGEWSYIFRNKKNTQKSSNTPQKKNMGVQAATFHSPSMLARPNKKSTPNLGLVGWCRPFIPCLQDPSLFGINRKTKTSQGMPGSVGTSLVSKGWGLKIDFSSNFLMIGSPP